MSSVTFEVQIRNVRDGTWSELVTYKPDYAWGVVWRGLREWPVFGITNREAAESLAEMRAVERSQSRPSLTTRVVRITKTKANEARDVIWAARRRYF